MKKLNIFLCILSVSLLMSCKKGKMKNFPTIIEISASQLPAGTNLEDLTLIFGQEEIIDDNTALKLHTVIQLAPFGYVDKYIETLEHGIYPNSFDISEINDPNWMIEEDDKISFIVEWDANNEDIRPWKNEIKFILTNDNLDGREVDYSSYNVLVKKEGEISVKLKPKKIYHWDLANNSIEETGGKSNRNDTYFEDESSNPLSGKWVQVTACSNSAGERNYFNFSSSSSGVIGQIDCNNSCSDGGVYTQFDYTVSGSNVSVTPLSVSDFCGTSPTLASPFTVPFSISGNTLTLDGTEFQKQ